MGLFGGSGGLGGIVSSVTSSIGDAASSVGGLAGLATGVGGISLGLATGILGGKQDQPTDPDSLRKAVKLLQDQENADADMASLLRRQALTQNLL